MIKNRMNAKRDELNFVLYTGKTQLSVQIHLGAKYK